MTEKWFATMRLSKKQPVGTISGVSGFRVGPVAASCNAVGGYGSESHENVVCAQDRNYSRHGIHQPNLRAQNRPIPRRFGNHRVREISAASEAAQTIPFDDHARIIPSGPSVAKALSRVPGSGSGRFRGPGSGTGTGGLPGRLWVPASRAILWPSSPSRWQPLPRFLVR